MPVFAGVTRVQVVLQGASLLAKDRFINTWHFSTPIAGMTAAERTSLGDRMISVYNTAAATSLRSVASYISPVVARTTDACSLRFYDLGQAEPRVPIIRPFTLAASGSTSPLPNEVAVCLSYYGGLNRVGQRGRIYFGPFNVQALETELAQPDVAEGLRTTMLDRAAFLANEASGASNWVLYSPAKVARPAKNGTMLPAEAGSFFPVTNGWIDDEFDTQRRRGLKARSRLMQTFA